MVFLNTEPPFHLPYLFPLPLQNLVALLVFSLFLLSNFLLCIFSSRKGIKREKKMGSCFSKKNSSDASQPGAVSRPEEEKKAVTQVEKKKVVQEESVKKEIFVIKHRKSHEVERRSEDDKKADEGEKSGKDSNGGAANRNVVLNGMVGGGAPVRTSSCTKEEVESILIQCGRLSRSSSTGKAGFLDSDGGGRRCGGKRYSGSKRSYDFDNENNSEGRKGNDDGSEENVGGVDGDDERGVGGERVHRHRQRHRSRTPSSPSKGRRRTPSREREPGQGGQQQRSGSRERGSGANGSGRRVSRSPGRRSESPITSGNGVGGTNTNSSGNANSNRPQKMVSVPATVSALAMDKSNNNGEPISAAAIKRIQVKRNVGSGGGGDASVGGARTVASPRARSPARTNVRVPIDNQQQPVSLSRSNSRKAEHSPYRRNPLSEIDTNVVTEQRPASGIKAANNISSQASAMKLNADNVNNAAKLNEKAREQEGTFGDIAVNVVTAAGPESLKTRSRSSRLSRDLDINPEALADPTPSYTTLLLEDIQNFHQKSSTPAAAFSLPACLTKACSILEAVADLNSTTSSNLSNAFSEGRKRNPTAEQQLNRKDLAANNHPGMKRSETKEPFLESEVLATDDLMEPSFHKYVTVRRGTTGGGDTDEQESSGSNSFVGSQQHWVSSSSWEPNSADSTDRWTSSRSNKEDDCSPLGFHRHAVSETHREVEDTKRATTTAKRREFDQQQNGIGRGRIGSRGLQHHSMPASAAAAGSS